MKWSDFEKYLKGEHLQGKKAVVQIAEITVEETHPRQGITEQTPVAAPHGVRTRGPVLPRGDD